MANQLGSKNGNSKLDEQDVEIIRWRARRKRELIEAIDAKIEALQDERARAVKSDSINQLALDFGVSTSGIKNVLYRNDIWGHVSD